VHGELSVAVVAAAFVLLLPEPLVRLLHEYLRLVCSGVLLIFIVLVKEAVHCTNSTAQMLAQPLWRGAFEAVTCCLSCSM
jgi:hypothetical protein